MDRCSYYTISKEGENMRNSGENNKINREIKILRGTSSIYKMERVFCNSGNRQKNRGLHEICEDQSTWIY